MRHPFAGGARLFRCGRTFTKILILPALFMSVACSGQSLQITGTALDVDIAGVITVADSRTSMLRQYAPDGSLIREIGGQGWGDEQFDHPSAVWARNGLDVFVADYGNHRVQRFDKNLAFVSSLSTRESDRPDERFGYPTGLSVSRLGELYICDSENERIVKVVTGNTVERTFGGYGAGAGRLYRPVMVACGPRDEVYVLDPPRVMVFDAFGNVLGELVPGGFGQPSAIAADQQGIAVLDSMTVRFFDEAQRPVATVAVDTVAAGPTAIALARGRVYVLSSSGLSILSDPRFVEPPQRLDKEGKSR